MIFEKLTAENVEKLKPFVNENTVAICDNCPATLFMWADFFATEICVEEDFLVLKNNINQNVCFSLPFGNVKKGIEKIRQNFEKPLFSPIAQDELYHFEQLSCKKEKIENWSDYLYLAENFRSLKGHKFHSKRNHVKRFASNYQFELETINDKNLKSVIAFLNELEKNSNQSEFEINATLKLLNNIDKFELTSLVLLVQNEVVGVTIGEKIGKTLVVHTERANKSFEGIFEFLAHAFVLKNHDVEFVNREEDMGIEGLKRSKQSWKPLRLLDKYVVELDN